MYFVELVFVLLIFGFYADALSLHGFNLLLREINETAATLDASTVTTEWIYQPLDHFNESDTRKWKMRYFQRWDKWKPSGPIYVFINGEGRAGKGFLQTGIMYELADETNGAMFLSEHRYYGKSKPFEEFTTENLQYLTSRQALADIARLINRIKQTPMFSLSKVVVVGGSYAGNLAAWMKLLYPNLISAAIASSGPVLAKEDFFEYLETVSDDFEQYGTPGCFRKITEIFQTYEKLFDSENGIKQLKAEEQICDETDMHKWENKQLFFLDKSSEFMSIAQYGNPDKIADHCEKINNSSRVFPPKYSDENMWNEKNQCYDYEFENMIEGIKEIDWYTAWIYQTCTEFGYYQITASENHPFTNNINIDFFYKMCMSAFGAEFDGARVEKGVLSTNAMYGGLKPNVSQVVFVNGDLDPWHRLGVLEDITYDAPAKIIPRVSHCRDLFSDRDSDPEELKEARRYIKYLVKKWIGAGEFAHPKV